MVDIDSLLTEEDYLSLQEYRKEKARLIKELTEGYKIRKSEDKQLSLEWETATGDGID
jgi:hypothetical protein